MIGKLPVANLRSGPHQHQRRRVCSEEIEFPTALLDNHRSLFRAVEIEQDAAAISIDAVQRGERPPRNDAVVVHREPQVGVRPVSVELYQGEIQALSSRRGVCLGAECVRPPQGLVRAVSCMSTGRKGHDR